MSPFSAPVLLGAAVLSSPALWRSLTGHMRLELGLTRYLITVVICWLALAAFVCLVGPPPRKAPEQPAEKEQDGTQKAAERQAQSAEA
jgi:uncharacterized membrane protein YdfJ with MMPL/SSD domain